MPTPRVSKQLNDKTYFLTFTINHWVDVFTNTQYFDLLISALNFYQANKGLIIYGYVVMTNHVHLIVESDDVIKFINGFKSYTSKEILKLLKTDNRRYVLGLLHVGKQKFSLWQYKNWPILIESEEFFNQKLNYIHENPVKKGYVNNVEAWNYSSARNYYCEDHSVIFIETDN